MSDLVAINCETTGVDLERSSLLSVAMSPVTTRDVPGTYHVWYVRHPDLLALDWGTDDWAWRNFERFRSAYKAHALPAPEVWEEIRSYLASYYPAGAVPVGHYVAFHLHFLRELGPLVRLAARRAIDTKCLAEFAVRVGKLPAETRTDLTSLCERFEIEFPDYLRNTAHGDSMATAKLYGKLVEVFA